MARMIESIANKWMPMAMRNYAIPYVTFGKKTFNG
jgi:hypothetical protein